MRSPTSASSVERVDGGLADSFPESTRPGPWNADNAADGIRQPALLADYPERFMNLKKGPGQGLVGSERHALKRRIPALCGVCLEVT